MLHPSERFQAPTAIQAGVPLKELLGPQALALIAESLAVDPAAFIGLADDGFAALGLMERAERIAETMAAHLPPAPDAALARLIECLGPTLASTESNGLKPFFYLPHSRLIARLGPQVYDHGMRANRELTLRFTAEFSIRPMLIAHQEACVADLARWAGDANPHVRRLVSEGTRPRLPWAGRLPAFQRDPTPVLPLLEALKDDPELYVRRSVANHLGDIAKDHPFLAFAVCRRWVDEVAGDDSERGEARRWLVRHAVRHPAGQGDADAEAIRVRAAIRSRRRAR